MRKLPSRPWPARRARGKSAILIGATLGLLVAVSPAQARTQTVAFDPPNSTQTEPVAINDRGDITGYFFDGVNSAYTGFLRTADGTITAFQPDGSVATFVTGMNTDGTTIGFYLDGNYDTHAFLRTSGGAITGFTYNGLGTQPHGINDKGTIAGWYADSNGGAHGFLRSANGKLTSFDVPKHCADDVYPSAINSHGVITGTCTDNGFDYHGFVRQADGRTKTFDPPGADVNTISGINAQGAIAGYDQLYSGFVRAPDGTFTAVNPDGSHGTTVESLNRDGEIAGFYADEGGVDVGFVYQPDGTVATFRVHGAGSKRYQGTFPTGINDKGATTGYFIDKHNASHGFARTK